MLKIFQYVQIGILPLLIAACGRSDEEKHDELSVKILAEMERQRREDDEKGLSPSSLLDKAIPGPIRTAANPILPIPSPPSEADFREMQKLREFEKLESEIEDLKRQAAMDRMNREIEQREAEGKERRREHNRHLGLE